MQSRPSFEGTVEDGVISNLLEKQTTDAIDYPEGFMAGKRYVPTVGKGLAAVLLALVAYAGLQYHVMLRGMDRAAAAYGRGDLEEALQAYEGVEAGLRAHGAMRL